MRPGVRDGAGGVGTGAGARSRSVTSLTLGARACGPAGGCPPDRTGAVPPIAPGGPQRLGLGPVRSTGPAL